MSKAKEVITEAKDVTATVKKEVKRVVNEPNLKFSEKYSEINAFPFKDLCTSFKKNSKKVNKHELIFELIHENKKVV